MFLSIWSGVRFHLLAGAFWRSEFSLFFTAPGKALWLGILLIYRPGFFDILPMYVFFLMLVVPALREIHSGRIWMALGLSILVWAGVQWTTPTETDALNPLAYQVYFVGGIAVSSLQDIRGKLYDARIAVAARWILALTVLLGLVRLGLGQLKNLDLNSYLLHGLAHLQKNGPLRVLNFGLFGFSAAFLWVRVSDELKKSFPFQWLSLLGRHSLQVFVWSVFVAYCLGGLMAPGARRFHRMANLALAVPSLAIPASFHEKLRKRNLRLG
jgi:hypothetical protein